MSNHVFLHSSRRGIALSRVALAALLALAACKKSGEPAAATGAASGAAGSGGATAGADDGRRAEDARLEAAIECLNRHSNRVFEAREAYVGSVDPQNGVAPAGRKPIRLGLYGVDQCKAGIAKATAVTPAMPEFDQASAKFVSALDALVAAWQELDGYYQKGDDAVDQGAKAKVLHPKVMAAFDAFAQANAALQGQVRGRNRKRHEDDLAAIEKQSGRNLEVVIGTLMLRAQDLLDALDATPADPAAVEARAADYAKVVDEVDAYAGAHADEAKQWGSLQNVRNYSKDVLRLARELAAKRKAGAKVEPGDLDGLVGAYNSLVENFNRH